MECHKVQNCDQGQNYFNNAESYIHVCCGGGSTVDFHGQYKDQHSSDNSDNVLVPELPCACLSTWTVAVGQPWLQIHQAFHLWIQSTNGRHEHGEQALPLVHWEHSVTGAKWLVQQSSVPTYQPVHLTNFSQHPYPDICCFQAHLNISSKFTQNFLSIKMIVDQLSSQED